MPVKGYITCAIEASARNAARMASERVTEIDEQLNRLEARNVRRLHDCDAA